MSHHRVLVRIDEAIERRHLLQHPLYRDWTAGTLPRGRLLAYAAQYYAHVEAFPRYLSAVHSHCGDIAVRQELLQNLVEEEQGEENHPELWLRFTDALGLERAAVIGTELYPETAALVGTFERMCREGSVTEGLAAIYAYEAQVPEIAGTKMEGLAKWYGVRGARGLRFFQVHKEADIVHRQVGRDLLSSLVRTTAEEDRSVRAAEEALDALWSMLDGVQRRAA